MCILNILFRRATSHPFSMRSEDPIPLSYPYNMWRIYRYLYTYYIIYYYHDICIGPSVFFSLSFILRANRFIDRSCRIYEMRYDIGTVVNITRRKNKKEDEQQEESSQRGWGGTIYIYIYYMLTPPVPAPSQ